MKRGFKKNAGLLLCLMVALFLTFEVKEVCAAASSSRDAKLLKLNKNYSYDLNKDGKKEKLKVTFTNITDTSGTIKIFINNKVKLKKEYVPIMGDTNMAWLSICDLNKKDKALDICVELTGASDVMDYMSVFQYNGKKVKLITTIKSELNNGVMSLYRYGNLRKISGNKKFMFDADTPYYNENFGCYICYLPAVYKENTIKLSSPSTYTMAKTTTSFKYTLNQSVTLYKKADKSQKVKTLKAGTKLYVKKIKPLEKLIPNVFESHSCFLYVKTSSGESGWIYVPADYDENNPYFKSIQSWG